MSNIKETLEVNEFAGTMLNAGVEIAPDGIKTAEILGKITLFLDAPEAFKGLGKYFVEQGIATIQDQEERKAAFGDQLTALKERSAYNVSNFAHGAQCLIAEIVEATADKVAEKIEKEGLPVRSMDAGELTGAELLAWATAAE